MRVFVTGASGFVGSAIVNELLEHGHQVLGLARSEQAAAALIRAGAAVHRGNLEDPESLKQGAVQCDAVIHTAFNHDFSRYKASCEEDRHIILALGAALAGSGRPLVITSGIGLLRSDKLATEDDVPTSSDTIPRAASEEAARTLLGQGINTYIVRLPPTVHGTGDHGFVPMLIDIAKEKRQSLYQDAGDNRWPAVHCLDAAAMYRMIVEQQPAQKVFHAVAEEGIPFRQIATAIGNGLGVPTHSSKEPEAAAYFGWFQHFATLDCAASGTQSSQTLNWQPGQTGILGDMVSGIYF